MYFAGSSSKPGGDSLRLIAVSPIIKQNALTTKWGKSVLNNKCDSLWWRVSENNQKYLLFIALNAESIALNRASAPDPERMEYVGLSYVYLNIEVHFNLLLELQYANDSR